MTVRVELWPRRLQPDCMLHWFGACTDEHISVLVQLPYAEAILLHVRRDLHVIKVEPEALDALDQKVSFVKLEQPDWDAVDTTGSQTEHTPNNSDTSVPGCSTDVQVTRHTEKKEEQPCNKKPKCSFNHTRTGYVDKLSRHGEKSRLAKKSSHSSKFLQEKLKRYLVEKPYKCKFCNKSFSKLSLLKYHTHVHTGEKPHKCTVCNKTFTQSGHLQSHRRIHTGERPFKCTICNKSFSESSHLTSHIRIHTGERPYDCTVCKKAFSHLCNFETAP
uniref:C2H2-type domain-containing protein n=1 Tax=Eptatretus burgeri TaxID=7764 RepID=A0A8C4Q3D0_EPTBU